MTTGAQARGLGTRISRDTLSWLGGWYLIVYQAQFATTFNLSVFVGGMVIVGIPGVLAVFGALTGAGTAGESPPPSDPPAVSQAPPPS